MTRRGFAVVPAIAAFALLAASASWAQNTGTRLPEAGSNHPKDIERFDEPGELGEIRELLGQGRLEKARSLARSLMAGDSSPDMQYAGLNAKCAIETRAGNLEAAIAACNKALEIRPNYWMALNSRGTAYYVARRYEAALADYRRALRFLSEDSDKAAVVKKNIRLVKQRQNADS